MMTLLGHLNELKDHLVRIAIALIVGTVGTFVFATRIFEWLLLPIQGHEDKVKITANTPTAAIGTYMKVALFSGAIVAMPFVVYQVLRYILPALTQREKRALLYVIPGATILFAGGVAFSYLVMIPPALSFLFSFWHEYIDQLWTIQEYLSRLLSQ